MRMWLKGTIPTAIAVLLLGGAIAAADVNLSGSVEVNKDVSISEDIEVTKDIELEAKVDIRAIKASESLAIVNQTNTGNEACENCAEKIDRIEGSVSGNSGVTSVNQATGNMNNQGTAISVSIDTRSTTPGGGNGDNGGGNGDNGGGNGDNGGGNGDNGGDTPTDPQQDENTGGFADAQAAAEQIMSGNTIDSINILFRDAEIVDSVNDNNGITAVNQSAGNINNQANVLSLAVSLEGGVAMAEAALGQENSGNVVFEANVNKSVTISGSVNGNTGITAVNQTAGNHANQANVVSFAGAMSNGNGGNGQ